MQNYYCTQGKDRIYVGTAPMLKEVSETYGYQTAMSWLAIQIGNLNSQLGYKWQMDVKQIDDCASLILERHSGLKVTELMAFFRGMKMGDYGELYGTVNMNAIMMGLNKFYTVRSAELGRIYDKEKSETKKAKERKRRESGLMAAEEYKSFLYDCKEYPNGTERIFEFFVEHGVKVTDAAYPRGRAPMLKECDPSFLIGLAEQRERMMKG